MTKIASTLFFLLICSTIAYSQQVVWFNDLEIGKAFARQNNKLIMIDFWAIWCGPCKKMDEEVWNTQEGAIKSQKFIPVKIDIDKNRRLAVEYNITSIPRVIFLDPNGERVIEEMGYGGSEKILSIMEELPGNIKELNDAYELLDQEVNYSTYYSLALAYQELGKPIDDSKIKDAFLDKSDFFLRNASKATVEPVVIQKIELTEIENLLYRGRNKKVLKQLDKNRESYSSLEENESYLNFLYALAHLSNGDKDEEEKYYKVLELRADGDVYIDKLNVQRKYSEN